jgi:hypothetical protein
MTNPTASNIPNGRKFYRDANGNPLAGGSVTFWIPASTTLLLVYLDDQQNTPSPNPVILDAAGSCAIFGTGEFREYVLDSLGNLISDTVVVASTPLFINPVMLPVLEATSIAAAEALLTASGGSTGPVTFTHLAISPGDETLQVQPTANPATTSATLNVQGPAVSLNQRDFLVNLGLTTAIGAGGTGAGAGGNDKVTLYTGLQANPSTSDVWTINTCLTQAANSGSYNAQGIELDFNNMNANRGANGNLGTDFTAPISVGLSVTGSSAFTSTSGIVVNNQGPAAVANAASTVPKQWGRSITTLGLATICAYQEWTQAPVGIQFDGAYSVAAINLTAVHGNAGGVTPTAMLMKNSQFLAWQTASTTSAVSDSVDTGNNRSVGLGASGVILGAATLPITTGNLAFGSALARWGDGWFSNLRLPNLGVLSWANANNTALIFDYVDASNNYVLGSGSTSAYVGCSVAFAPLTAGLGQSLGTSSNYWGNVWSSGGIATPSDIRLKTDISPVVSALNVIDSITPIMFRWIDDSFDPKLHYGFDAAKVQAAYPADFAGVDDDGDQLWLKKDELIATLWAGLKELAAKVAILEARLPA